jgi:hypothetical protein
MRMKRKAIVFATSALLLIALGVLAQTKPASVAGAWHVSMEGQSAAVIQTLALAQKGAAITGTIKAAQGTASPIQGKVNGQNITFTVTRQAPDGPVKQEFAGTINGNSIAGTVTQGQFHVGWTAVRAK